MSIDTDGMRKAAEGDQSKKIAVSKRWLATVADEIDQLRKNQKQPMDNIISDLLNKGKRY